MYFSSNITYLCIDGKLQLKTHMNELSIKLSCPTHRSGNNLFLKKYPPETVRIFETTIKVQLLPRFLKYSIDVQKKKIDVNRWVQDFWWSKWVTSRDGANFKYCYTYTGVK